MKISTYRHAHNRNGFTIVELILGIVVIAILAVIIIVAYNGIRRRAIETTLKADLHTSATAIELDKERNGQYSIDAQDVNNGSGLRPSGSNTLTYDLRSYGFCLGANNQSIGVTFVYRSTGRTIQPGRCSSTIATLAGSGTPGLVDGTGTAAQFYYPYGICVTPTGTVYVADHYNHRIRQITQSGVVSTLSATGFSYPGGIVVDASGTVYVADTNHHRIVKILSSGAMTTLAGTGTAGFADGAGSSAQFDRPYGLALDSSGMLYVADFNNNRIRKISPAGVVSTLAGSGAVGANDSAASSASFYNPVGGCS